MKKLKAMILIAVGGLLLAPQGVLAGFTLEGEDLVLRVETGMGGSFRMERASSWLRLVLSPGTPEPDLTLPEDPRLLVTRAAWEVSGTGAPSVFLALGAGDLQVCEAIPGAVRLIISPALGSATPYVIGPDDVLNIRVYGEEELSGSVTVDLAGNISIGLVGMVQAAGHTSDELAEIIHNSLGAEYLTDPRVTVEVTDYRSHRVSILGPVVKQDPIAIRNPVALSNIIQQAGGFSERAGYHLTIRRHYPDGSEQTFQVSRADLEAGRVDPLILPDDVITVAEVERFFIDGEVGKASAYQFRPGLTLMQAIAVAGGTTPWADETKIQIHRRVGGQAILETFNLKKIRAHRAPDPGLRPGDMVVVPRRFL